MGGPTQGQKNIVGMMKMIIENFPSWEDVDGLLLRTDYDFILYVWNGKYRNNDKCRLLTMPIENRISVLERTVVNEKWVDAHNCYMDIQYLNKIKMFFKVSYGSK